MFNKNTKENHPLFSFLTAKEQRIDWFILFASCLIGYIILKICYPYPATISDSATYVKVAMIDTFSFYRPFGYSAFLQKVHAISKSIHAIFIAQIILYFLSTATFAFVIKYLYPPANKTLWRVLLLTFVFSPLAFYMSNAIMSDLLFAVLIYFMLASFLICFKTRSWIALVFFFLTLYFALQVRYSALVFPILFILAFLLQKSEIRWIGIAGIIVVSVLFYNQVRNDMHKTTGLKQFSTGFDGWQMTNNALHVIPYIDLDPAKIEDPNIRILHQYMLSQKDVITKRTNNGEEIVASFMWINDLPMKKFLFSYIEHSQESYPMAWVKLGSYAYKDYGKYIITHYPIEYMRHYYLPNAKSIIYPTSKEIVESYTPINVKDIFKWYRIEEGTDMNAKHDIYGNFVAELLALSYIPIWLILATLAIASFVLRKKLPWHDTEGQKLFWVIVFFGILYYSSTVFASPISIRFWIPMNAILFAIIYILSNRLVEYKKIKPTEKLQ